MIDGLCQQIREELSGTATVVATGGLSGMVSKLSTQIDLIDPMLTLDGLRIIYKMNARSSGLRKRSRSRREKRMKGAIAERTHRSMCRRWRPTHGPWPNRFGSATCACPTASSRLRWPALPTRRFGCRHSGMVRAVRVGDGCQHGVQHGNARTVEMLRLDPAEQLTGSSCRCVPRRWRRPRAPRRRTARH